MQVVIGSGSAELVEADVFTALSVSVGSLDDQTVADTVRREGLGVAELPGHVWLEPDALRRLAGAAATAEWMTSFDGMVAYAVAKGWADDDGRIRAHVVEHAD